MDFTTIIVEKKDQIGSITLNRPDKMNTFSSQLARELNDALRHMDADDQVRVAIVKGAGKAFSTGIDIAEFAGKTAQEYQAWSALMDEMHLTIAAMAKPVIATRRSPLGGKQRREGYHFLFHPAKTAAT